MIVRQKSLEKQMDYAGFQKQVDLSRKAICKEIYSQNRDAIRIKKEGTVLRNLEIIFNAALKISNQKGFQAMSMRDLSSETGLSTGALYAYFAGKEELLNMMQRQQGAIVREVLDSYVSADEDPPERLKTMLRAHLYLSEAMKPWFYFSFMEAKNLSRPLRDMAVSGSRTIENHIETIIREGIDSGFFRAHDPVMSASLIKAMLQDWYLKSRKYSGRNVGVDQYADFMVEFVMAYLRGE